MIGRTARTAVSSLGIVVALCACYLARVPTPRFETDGSRQLLVVITPDWPSTRGTLSRYYRASDTSEWNRLELPIPVVVGRTGLAWGVGFDTATLSGPHKQEGDGKSPAGIFPLDTAFGFAPPDRMRDMRLPYVQLLPTHDCVDDIASTHYNTIVDKATVPRVDWNSAENMRDVAQYKIGVTVGYNASPPIKGRGSCIFLHIWAGPESYTAGCTALDEAKLREIMAWLDPLERPLLVQMTGEAYTELTSTYRLPKL